MTYRDTYVEKVFNTIALSGSGTEYSSTIDLGAKAIGGNFALQIYVTGSSASVTATYQLRNDPASSWVTPTGASDICTNYPGAAAQDYEIFSFSPEAARYLRIAVSETQGNDASVTAWFSLN